MLRKEPGLGLLGVGLKPTTSTLSLYIPEESRAEGSTDGAFDVFVPKEWEKDQSVAHGEERAEGEGDFTSSSQNSWRGGGGAAEQSLPRSL